MKTDIQEEEILYTAPMQTRAAASRGAYLPRRCIRREELRLMVPLSNTTIHEMEQRNEFPRRFFLTSRTVVWDMAEVEAWIEQRRRASEDGRVGRAPAPDVRKRKKRPVR